MYSIVIIFAALGLHLSSVYGDIVVRSQTYNISATAVDKHERTVKVRGHMIDFKLLYFEPEDQANNDLVSFSVAVNEQDGTNADVYQLNGAFPVPNFPTADSASKRPKNSTRRKSQPSAPSSTPAPLHDTNAVPTNNFDTAPPFPFSNVLPNALPFPLLMNRTQEQSSDLKRNFSSLDTAQPFPSQSGAQPNNSGPTQTFQTSQQHQCANPPHKNVFDKNNPETRQHGGPRADDTMPMQPPYHHPPNSLGGAPPAQSQVGGDQFKIQNVALRPTNGITSMNLAPVRGQPWTSDDRDNSAQVYENTPVLNLRSPLRNISVVSSDDETGTANLTTMTSTYTGLDAASLMQKLEPVNKKVISDLVGDFLESEANATMSPTDMAAVQDIVEEIDQISNMMNDMVPLNIPTAEINFVPVPKGKSRSTEPLTTKQQPTTMSEYTTSLNGSTNATTSNVTSTETPSGGASGIRVTPFLVAVPLVLVTIVTRTIMAH